ncbi:TonB family protein [Caulobacter sp.]|uniref:energy transducer TonB n=1 Tax=Caulobacter sp. TaxID=78 RepID=UPI001B1D80ED|nr:TonB family protein [Caulobacter sp.]MBO9546093.1 TonB family protein [Caulobacter sp.]
MTRGHHRTGRAGLALATGLLLAWPAAAQVQGEDPYPNQAPWGKVMMRCFVTAQGTLKDCEVLSETPKDLGLSAAALRLSAQFRMKPKTVNGKPVDGGKVIIPLIFKAPPETEPSQEP